MTDEQLAEALRLRAAGLSIAGAAERLGVSKNALTGYLWRYYRKTGAKPRKRTWFHQRQVHQQHQQRTISRTLKPPAEVNDLARQLSEGRITTSEFCYRIRA